MHLSVSGTLRHEIFPITGIVEIGINLHRVSSVGRRDSPSGTEGRDT